MAANVKIPGITNEIIWPASDDLFEGVDVSESNDDPTGDSGKVKQGNIVKMLPITETSTDYTVTDTDLIILVDDTSSTRTITINTDQHKQRRQLIIKDISGNAATNNISVVTQGSKTFDGETSIDIDIDYGALTIVGDSSNWSIIT